MGAGQGGDPDLSYLGGSLLYAAAEAQHLATLGGGSLRHLSHVDGVHGQHLVAQILVAQDDLAPKAFPLRQQDL